MLQGATVNRTTEHDHCMAENKLRVWLVLERMLDIFLCNLSDKGEYDVSA